MARRTQGGRLVLTAGTVGAGVVLVAVLWPRRGWITTHIDRPVLQFVVHHRSGIPTTLLRWVTALGDLRVMSIVAAVVIVWQLRRHRRHDVATIVVGTWVSAAVVAVAKALVARPRPPNVEHLDLAGGAGFPSSHAAVALGCTVAVALVLSRERGRWVQAMALGAALAVAAAVGFSRVYLGVHWPSDVVAGWCVGAACLSLARLVPRPAVGDDVL